MRPDGRPMLAWIGIAAAACLGGCGDPLTVAVDAVELRIRAQDETWGAEYVLPQPQGGGRGVSCGRDIHVPLGAEVVLSFASRDYIYLFSSRGLGLRDFVAPGVPTEVRFRADREGIFDLRADEMCGLPHVEKSAGRLVVESPAAFQKWVRAQAKMERK